jgi:predicted Zn-dependent peptidase
MDDPQAGMTLAWTAPSVHDPDWPAVALHHSVYAGGFTSPLVRRIRAEAGLSYDVSSDLIGGRDHSLQVLDISPESAEVGRVFDEVASCWQSFVADDLDADEVETARGRLLGGHAIGLETVRQRLRAAITQRWLGRPIEALTDLPDRVRNVTLDDLTRVATRWGPGASNVTAVVAAPVDALDDAAARVDLSRTEFDLDTVT